MSFDFMKTFLTKKQKVEKLSLGTAQFGFNYGIANKKGKITFEEAEEILSFARISGIKYLDTAILYGESEKVLGEIGVNDLKICTKLPSVSTNKAGDIKKWVDDSISRSIKLLKISNLESLLLHRPRELLGENGERLYKALIRLKESGLIQKIGISIYDPLELEDLIKNFNFDIVQAPMNVFDRRLINSGWLDKLDKCGIEIHIRSVFLQGLLLMKKEELPYKFKKWEDLWIKWHTWLNETNQSALQVCLGYLVQIQPISKIIVGVDNLKHLKEIVIAIKQEIIKLPDELFSNDENLIDPSKW
ncbi:oxidoreductase, aldo/keto reductase family protein [Leptospira kirschneri serovar Bim str. 1051]|nr:oxidoreductase, aldo/keto reductase family protein [Leptospira kirschneri serovar Bim str. PUO 1247]EMN05164.1 oxidoreductase, aldo/keto reductase family protein [Leptospira kirschneri serovar Bim str. 1051]